MAFSFLILDDELVAREQLKGLILSIDSESKVLMASTYKVALEILKSGDIDVYLIDVDLNGKKNGIDFIKEIKRRHPLSQIIIVSAKLDPEFMLKAYQGLDILRYVTKPYDHEKVAFDVKLGIQYAKVQNNQKVTFRRQGLIRTYSARNILCVRRVPKDKKKIIVTVIEDGKIVSEEFSIKRSLGEVPELFRHENSLVRCHTSWLVNPKMTVGADLFDEKLILRYDVRVPYGGDKYRAKLAPFTQGG